MKNFKNYLIIIIVLSLIVGGIAGFYYGKSINFEIGKQEEIEVETDKKVEGEDHFASSVLKKKASILDFLFKKESNSITSQQITNKNKIPLLSTSEITLVKTFPCNNSDIKSYECNIIQATVNADSSLTTLDDPLLSTNLLLAVRKKRGTPLTNRWIIFEAGDNGNGYGPNFGEVAPGEYVSGGAGYGDDLIRYYNELGYVTVDTIWECLEAIAGDPCYSKSYAGWVPAYSNSSGWIRNTGGGGYVAAASRTRAVVEWIMANNGGKTIGAHGHSSGSGRLITTMTRYGSENLYDTIVFDGGPVFAYIPWYCGITDDGNPDNGIATPGALGPKPADFDIENYDGIFRSNYDNARDQNNGEGENPYRNCTNHIWDEIPMMDDSNFYQALDYDFPTVDIAVILGGIDITPSSAHARLWFHGYTYGAESVPAISAKSLTIHQGYCSNPTDATLTYVVNGSTHPCTDWDPSQFLTASLVTYVSSLATVSHRTAESLEGATDLFNTMLTTLELIP